MLGESKLKLEPKKPDAQQAAKPTVVSSLT